MASPEWRTDGTLEVDGVVFVPSPPGAGRFPSTSTRFCLVKRRDLIEDHLEIIADLIAHRRLGDRVHVHHRLDQSDGTRLREVLDASLGDRSIDLVVDDASHSVEPTRASFNVLFPRLRPGGWYVLDPDAFDLSTAYSQRGRELVVPLITSTVA